MALMNDNQYMSRNYYANNGQNKEVEDVSLASKLRELTDPLDDTKETESEEEDMELNPSHGNLQKKLETIQESFEKTESVDDSYIEDGGEEDPQKKFLAEQNYEVVNMIEDSMISGSIQYKKGSTPDEEDDEEGDAVDDLAKLPKNEARKLSIDYISEIFHVRNIDTGEVFDMRNADQFKKAKNEAIPDSTNLRLQGLPWKQYWKKVRENNELLWDYAEEGSAEKVLTLLKETREGPYPAQVNSRTLDDMTALHLAAAGGHKDVIKVLMSYNSDVNAQTKMGRTPLHVAVLQGHLEVVRLLISYKADINAIDNEFSTPLHYASERGHIEVIEELLASKPQVTRKNHAGLTALDVALNSATWRLFENWNLHSETMLSAFGRISVDDFLIYNSRADYVSKILFMHNKLYRQKNEKPLEQPVCGTTETDKSNKKLRRKDTSKFKSALSKMVNQHNSWKNSSPLDSINDSTMSGGATEKVNVRSFICHTMLGKGSFGEVYLVEKISNKKLYAMKVLRKDKVLSQNLTRYAKTERNVLSLMNHPFIVKLSYAFQTDTKLYLLLEYCPGGDLGNMLTRKKRFSEDLARIYAAEVTLALEELHKANIIFRDLKPDNVVIDAEGHAHLTDFGLSKEGVKDNLSKSFCGSVAYLAPEMLRRSGHNRTVDWYLLGVLIYEMLVGVPPYFSSNREELFDNIQKAQLKLPRSMSDEAKSLIKSLLNRNPMKRLGAENDAEDIKQHAWFKSINWDDAMDRKLQPPKPFVKKLNNETLTKVPDDIEDGVQSRDYIANWSFVVPDENA